MNGSETLRNLLDSANVKYDELGKYTTIVRNNGVSWTVYDNYDGTVSAYVTGKLSPDDALGIVTLSEHVSTMTVVVDEDGLGRSTCDSCGRGVGEWFIYCPWCGSRFTERNRSVR